MWLCGIGSDWFCITSFYGIASNSTLHPFCGIASDWVHISIPHYVVSDSKKKNSRITDSVKFQTAIGVKGFNIGQ